VCQDHVTVIEFDRKRRARKNLFDATEHLERSFLGILGSARLGYARAGPAGSIANSDWTYSFQERQICRMTEKWRSTEGIKKTRIRADLKTGRIVS
jgi:hypothetical protein